MGDTENFEGGSDVIGPLGRPGWNWRQRLMQKASNVQMQNFRHVISHYIPFSPCRLVLPSRV